MAVLADPRAHARAVYDDVDRSDAVAFASHITPDGSMTFGNADPMVGRDAITEGIAQFFMLIDGLSHEIVECWAVDRHVICDLMVTYRRKDGRSVTVPAVTIWEMDGDLVRDYRVYIDQTPVFAR